MSSRRPTSACRSEARSRLRQRRRLRRAAPAPRARHIEVQIVGDGSGGVTHFWRARLQHPAPAPEADRDRAGARRSARGAGADPRRGVRLAARPRYAAWARRVPGRRRRRRRRGFAFIEANPRLQVEHTVTEEVTGPRPRAAAARARRGRDAGRARLTQREVPAPRGIAIQARVNMETHGARRDRRSPAAGRSPCSSRRRARAARRHASAMPATATSPRFDSLLAKVIVHRRAAATSPTRSAKAVPRARRVPHRGRADQHRLPRRACCAIRTSRPDGVDTRFVDEHMRRAARRSAATAGALLRRRARPSRGAGWPARGSTRRSARRPRPRQARAGRGRVRQTPPTRTRRGRGRAARVAVRGADAGHDRQRRRRARATTVRAGQPAAGHGSHEDGARDPAHRSRGIVRASRSSRGDTVFEGHAARLRRGGRRRATRRGPRTRRSTSTTSAPTWPRCSSGTRDDPRRRAARRRRAPAQDRPAHGAREHRRPAAIRASFVEYGPLVIAAQRRRRTVEDLIESTPADGLVTGVGRVNGTLFGGTTSRCVVMALRLHRARRHAGHAATTARTTGMFELAERAAPAAWCCFTEGGGGRPGDTDGVGVAGLDSHGVPHLRPAERAGAAGRHHLGPLLRRQRGAARLLRRGHRHGRTRPSAWAARP